MNYFREVEGLPISLISERTRFTPVNMPVNANMSVEPLSTGTTTVGIIGKEFVLLAADQQATMGSMAVDDDAKKVYRITKRIGLTISGSVGDSLAVIRFLRSQANLYEIERGVKMTPKALSNLLSNILNGNRYYPFIFMPIVGGIGEKPQLYEITPFGDISKKTKYAVTGSGTDFALAVLDGDYKPDMNEDDALALAIKAVLTAKNRDIYTGGKGITAVLISKKEFRKLDEKDIEKAIAKIKLNFSKKGN